MVRKTGFLQCHLYRYPIKWERKEAVFALYSNNVNVGIIKLRKR